MMKPLKKNIWIIFWVATFLQPQIFNMLHFVLVGHDQHWEFENSENEVFKNRNESHNCEQFLFKVPPVTELNLTQEISSYLGFSFHQINEIETEVIIQNINFSHPKRGPPKLNLKI